MKAILVKLYDFSGKQASIYAVWIDSLSETTFERLVNENKNLYLSELLDIAARLRLIGNNTGARSQFFREREGVPGDGVCALYDYPGGRLRLYCIRYGTLLVIAGGGGSKNVQKLQDDPVLERENYLMRELSKRISERIRSGEIYFVNDGMDIDGNLEFENINYE